MTPVPLTYDVVGGKEKFLLYGDPGMGKTFTALTLPGPIYFLSIGSSSEAETYFGVDFQKKHGKKEIFIDVALEDFDAKGAKPASGVENVRRLLEGALELDYSGKLQFASIIIDNATRLSEYMMNKVIEVGNLSRDVNATGVSTYQKYAEHGILTPFDSDWGASQSMMTKFTSGIFRLNKHVVFVAHEWEKTLADRKTKAENTIAIKPLFIGKQRDEIANLFSNVWRMTRNAQQYEARTVASSNPTLIAKVRMGGVIPKDYPDPNLSDVIEQFRKQGQKVSPVQPSTTQPSS